MSFQLKDRVSIASRINAYQPYTTRQPSYVVEGRLIRMVGLTLEAEGCNVPIGGHCIIRSPDIKDIEAEVVGFSGPKLFLMPLEPVSGLQPGARVIPLHQVASVPVGDQLLGRVLDGRGLPLDGKGAFDLNETVPLARAPINPLHRRPISEPGLFCV